MPTKKQIEEILKTIPDPELNISVWDLGLIYDVAIDKAKSRVTIVMTLTTMGCPLFNLISEPIKAAVGALPGVVRVDIDLTFEPPWSVEKMSEDAKMQLGFV